MSAPTADSQQPGDLGAAVSILERYAAPGHRWDEMLDDQRRLRPPWRDVGSLLVVLGAAGLTERHSTVRRLLEDDGVTYRPYGSPLTQPWSLDPVPLVLDEAEWAGLQPGLRQRAELLDAIQEDLYTERTLISSGLVPPEVIFGHAGFIREVDQIRLPGARQLFLTATDLARTPDGSWCVLHDRTQAPSGAGYVMENRRATTRAMTGLHRISNIHRIGPFFQVMRESLQRLSPTSVEAPRVVMLTPGIGSETSFDQAYLSSLLGFPLVEGSDLTFRDGRLWQRSASGRPEPVDVLLRRVDSWFCDPLELRPDSHLGVPGLVEACRRGTLAVANPLGSGVLENPGLFPFLEAISRHFLGEALQLPSVPTWWCGDSAGLSHALANAERLVFKPISRLVGSSSQLGWRLGAQERELLLRAVKAQPHAWVVQEAIEPSSAPTVTEAGIEPRPMLLRTFAVSDGAGYRLMDGGLVRVANSSDAETVSNLDGATSKDLWVLAPSPQQADGTLPPRPLTSDVVHQTISPRVAADMFWLGRYAERVEQGARLLRVTDDRWRDSHLMADTALSRALRTLLMALTTVTATQPGFTGVGSTDHLEDPRAELLSMIGDGWRPGTIAHDVARLQGLANAVRDQLSSDTWLVFGGLDRSLAPFQADYSGFRNLSTAMNIGPALTELNSLMLAFSGVMGENMVRDEGWFCLDMGRRLERAIGTALLVRATLGQENDPEAQTLVMESTLLAADTLMTHRRRFTAGTGPDTLLSLLLLAPDNPRSVAFSLERLDGDLKSLGEAPEGAARSEVRSILATLAESEPEQLAIADETGARRGLQSLLTATLTRCGALTGAIEDSHFAQPAALMPLDPFEIDGTSES